MKVEAFIPTLPLLLAEFYGLLWTERDLLKACFMKFLTRGCCRALWRVWCLLSFGLTFNKKILLFCCCSSIFHLFFFLLLRVLSFGCSTLFLFFFWYNCITFLGIPMFFLFNPGCLLICWFVSVRVFFLIPMHWFYLYWNFTIQSIFFFWYQRITLNFAPYYFLCNSNLCLQPCTPSRSASRRPHPADWNGLFQLFYMTVWREARSVGILQTLPTYLRPTPDPGEGYNKENRSRSHHHHHHQSLSDHCMTSDTEPLPTPFFPFSLYSFLLRLRFKSLLLFISFFAV